MENIKIVIAVVLLCCAGTGRFFLTFFFTTTKTLWKLIKIIFHFFISLKPFPSVQSMLMAAWVSFAIHFEKNYGEIIEFN